MLLTINYKAENSQDIGYLLHKNPGKAYVFYPEVSDESTTAALLLDIDPIDLARGKVGSKEGGLFDYINDRPYVCSSFMSTAITKIFGTAMSGRCSNAEKQGLADSPLALTAKLHMLPAPNFAMIPDIFEPLGYAVEVEHFPNDEKFSRWGQSKYINLTISGTVRLCELLNHLYTLIPVFDTHKHYYTSSEEIDKLLSHGSGWLKSHPKCEYITSRYLHKRGNLVKKALRELVDEDDVSETTEPKPKPEKITLNRMRLDAVIAEVLASGAASVIDMGCGEGNLTKLLIREKQIKKVAAFDVSFNVLERAKKALKIESLHETLQDKLTLFQASLTYRDKRFEGFDCACAIEVMEHMDESRLTAFERVLFEFSRPRTVIITTPNVEYNVNYENLNENKHRHSDHRFEWTKSQFADWCNAVCERHGYSVKISDIGELDESGNSPTQMGVFTL
jgi:3' terminal RNA ribose 2'-O-methyltransferase Hen1